MKKPPENSGGLLIANAQNSVLRLADPFGISAGAGVDLHDIALVDEKRNLNFVTVVDFGRLGHVGGGVAADARLGFGDLFFDEGRQRDFDRLAVVEHEVADAVLDQEVGLIAEGFSRNRHLFIGGRIAENVVVAVEIGVEHFTFFEVRLFDFIGRTVGFFHAGAVDHVFQAAAVERSALAGIAEIELGDDPRRAVDLDLQAFLQVGWTEHV